MVKKLFKYEFLSYFKIMGIVYIVLLSIAAFDRISRFFESDSTIYSIVSGFSVATYVVTLFAVFVFSFLLSIIRFYKNFFIMFKFFKSCFSIKKLFFLKHSIKKKIQENIEINV